MTLPAWRIGGRASRSRYRHVRGFDPDTNTEIAEVVPDDVQWELLALTVPLVQGAAQTPQPMLRIRTASDPVNATQTITLSAVPAGGACTVTFTPPDDYHPAGTTPIATPAIDGTGGISAAEVQTALTDVSMLAYGLSGVTVAGNANGPFTVTFAEGAVSGRPIPLLQVTDNTLEDAGTDPVEAVVAHGTAGVLGGTLYEALGSSAAQANTTTCRYTWGQGLPTSGQIGATTNVHSTAPLPSGLLLDAGTRIGTLTIGLGANTAYGQPDMYVIEYG